MEKVDAKDLSKKAIGKYVIMWQTGDKKTVGMVDSIDEKDNIIVFIEHGGKNDGVKFKSHYDIHGKDIYIYEKEEAIIALLDS